MMRETAALTLRMLAGLAAAPVAAALISVGTYDLSWHAGLLPHGTGLLIVARSEGMMNGDWFTLSGILVRIAMGVIGGAGGAATFWLVSVCGTTDGAGRSSLPLGT
ncbi:MAG TPA: hypothetical protein VFS23_01100 [Vicinamibacterales bacterium]|nr:hypothetical protein [Vicinamibacterales bacterium]